MEDRMELSLERLRYFHEIVDDTFTKTKIEKFEKFTKLMSVLGWIVIAA